MQAQEESSALGLSHIFRNKDGKLMTHSFPYCRPVSPLSPHNCPLCSDSSPASSRGNGASLEMHKFTHSQSRLVVRGGIFNTFQQILSPPQTEKDQTA